MKTLEEQIQIIINKHPVYPYTPMAVIDIIQDLKDALNEVEKERYDWTKGTFKDLRDSYTNEDYIAMVQG